MKTNEKAEALVKRFNELYPVGSTVQWRSENYDGVPYRTHTVSRNAFVAEGQAVGWLQGCRGWVSIEPGFVNYYHTSNQPTQTMQTNEATGTIAETLSEEELEALLAKKREAKQRDQERKKKEYEAHRNMAVIDLCEQASVLADQVALFHGHSHNVLKDLGDRLTEYGELRGNSKGGFSVTSDDGKYKVSHSFSTISDYDERADKAEVLLKEVLGDTVKKRDTDLHDIILSLLERNAKGRLEYGRIARLFQYENKFSDPRWREALRLFKEAYTVRGSKFYTEFFERNEHGAYVKIELNFSRLGAMEQPAEEAEAEAV